MTRQLDPSKWHDDSWHPDAPVGRVVLHFVRGVGVAPGERFFALQSLFGQTGDKNPARSFPQFAQIGVHAHGRHQSGAVRVIAVLFAAEAIHRVDDAAHPFAVAAKEQTERGLARGVFHSHDVDSDPDGFLANPVIVVSIDREIIGVLLIQVTIGFMVK